MFFKEINLGVVPVVTSGFHITIDGKKHLHYRLNLNQLVNEVPSVKKVRVRPVSFNDKVVELFPDGSRELILPVKRSGVFKYALFPFFNGVRPAWWVFVEPVEEVKEPVAQEASVSLTSKVVNFVKEKVVVG